MSLEREVAQLALQFRLARLATADPSDHQPHVVPICFTILDGNVYFVVDEKPKLRRRELRRLRNIRNNPRVALLWDDYSEDWDRLTFLLAFGRAYIVSDRAEWERAVSSLRDRYPQYQRMSLRFEDNPAVRIEVVRCHRWQASH